MTDEAGSIKVEAVAAGFAELVPPKGTSRCIADGFQFTEGPVWSHKDACLFFSDIPADIICKWREDDGTSIWRRPSHHANGNTVDTEGRLLTCQHGSRTLTRTEADGRITTLASTYGGRRLNSPNDVVVKTDGSIWFTDPPYGIDLESSEQPANYVFRLDEGMREPVAVAEDFSRPNGLCFSPDERLLYIADSDTDIHHVRRFDVEPDNTLEGGDVFAVIEPGVPDGMRIDAKGNLWTSAGDGIQVFAPEGRLLGKIRTPKPAANCAFGGPDFLTLFITAQTHVWAVALATSA